MTIASFLDLTDLLVRDGVPFEHDSDTQSVTIPTEKPPLTGEMLIRWERDSLLIQCIHPLPFTVPDDRTAAAESAIAWINHALLMPGFGLDHAHKTLYFRLSVPRRPDGTMTDDEVRRLFSTTVETAASFYLPLRHVALEGGHPEDALAQAGPPPA